MAYVDGQSLKEKLVGGPLPFDEALEMCVQVALGLGEAHAKVSSIETSNRRIFSLLLRGCEDC